MVKTGPASAGVSPGKASKKRETRNWSEEEVKLLTQAAGRSSTSSWDAVAAHVGHGRSGFQCRVKFRRLNQGRELDDLKLAPKLKADLVPRTKNDLWTVEKVNSLSKAILAQKDFKSRCSKGCWGRVAKQLGGGVSDTQCRDKFEVEVRAGRFAKEQNHITNLSSKYAFTAQDIQDLKRVMPQAQKEARGAPWLRAATLLDNPKWTWRKCQTQWHLLVKNGEVEAIKETKYAPWTAEELHAFHESVKDMDAIDCEVISRAVKTKTFQQCRKRLEYERMRGLLPKPGRGRQAKKKNKDEQVDVKVVEKEKEKKDDKEEKEEVAAAENNTNNNKKNRKRKKEEEEQKEEQEEGDTKDDDGDDQDEKDDKKKKKGKEKGALALLAEAASSFGGKAASSFGSSMKKRKKRKR